ncbi:hypothetical protein PIB30_005230 [Stylosanthes scabra]|uniref:Uncharacterized protein n=1 Tax=Stylosanthes scabra TaxID=79078 RepID=A0ABU6T3P4_9FABA|nr:hypothetical protein [Stylosanthes scabra]
MCCKTWQRNDEIEFRGIVGGTGHDFHGPMRQGRTAALKRLVSWRMAATLVVD